MFGYLISLLLSYYYMVILAIHLIYPYLACFHCLKSNIKQYLAFRTFLVIVLEDHYVNGNLYTYSMEIQGC